jgi:hypothetical protein
MKFYCCVIWYVTRRVPLVEEKLLILVIVLSVLRFTYSDYSFDIFKILYVNMCFAFAVDCVREILKS